MVITCQCRVASHGGRKRSITNYMEEENMEREFVEENQEPIYNYEDCANMIQERTGLSREIIADVLNAEIDYMKSIGIIDEDEDAYFQV